ncbi:MAG: PAAR-like domain-containing protein [Litoreibacter sp.]
MANDVFANGREISCKAGDGKSIGAFPDVCMTPPENPATPPGVPVPYPNTGMTGDCTSGSTTVKISGKEAMLKNKSYFKKSMGDEAGAAAKKGVVSSKNRGKVYFTAWSMDVKIEGENAVRHLDMTTHNHGSAMNTPPWPFADSMAMAADVNHPCNDMGKDIKANCADENDYSSACCGARKCLMDTFANDSCCAGPDGNKMSAHHLLPSKEFVSKKQRRALRRRGAVDPTTGYAPFEAPCICVQGTSHHMGTEHGDVGCNYTVERKKWIKDPINKGKAYSRDVACDVAAESAVGKVNTGGGASKGCNKECLSQQLKDGHNKMDLTSAASDPMPRGKQPPPKPMVTN